MNPQPKINIDWQKGDGLVPAIIQDAETRQVLMLGYMNQVSFAQTLETRKVTFFSRSRKALWIKGETSGHFLNLVSWSVDCDNDTILIQANPQGPTCHLGTKSCFGELKSHPQSDLHFLRELQNIVDSRFASPDAQTSYVGRLIAQGPDRMAQKVGEEAIETVIAAKNEDRNAFEGEAADLLFHLMVLLRSHNSSLTRVTEVLKARHIQK